MKFKELLAHWMKELNQSFTSEDGSKIKDTHIYKFLSIRNVTRISESGQIDRKD